MGRGVLFGLLLCAAALMLTSAGKLNMGYLVPGGNIKLDQTALAGPKFCALTFDDGPDGTYTMQVARILEQHGVRATFFVLGNRVRRYPQQVLALQAAGHAVENHSWAHPDFTKLSDASKREEIARTSAELEKLGIRPRWFRPPFGAFDKATLRVCRECGLEPILWSVDPKDWARPGSDAIVSRVLNGTGNGAVILLHSTNGQTVEALPRLLTRLKADGYSFVTMDEWALRAQGRPLPSAPLPGAPGMPPSFREHLPGETPQLPAPPVSRLAAAQDEAHPDTVGPPQPVMAQSADPDWVDSMTETFYEPFENLAPTHPEDLAPPEPVAPEEPAAVPSPLDGWPVEYQRGWHAYAGVLRSAWHLRWHATGLRPYGPAVEAAAQPREADAAPADGPGLRVYGNFAHTDEAEGILDTRRSGSLRRLR